MKSIKGIGERVLLVIFDGFGINRNSPKNAIADATTPNIDALFNNFPFTTIKTCGEDVGLPNGVMGNSEVGHLNLGAGRPVQQDLVRINESIKKGKFSNLEKLKELIKNSKNGSKRIHLMSLLSDGGVHSHIDHIKEAIKVLSKEGIEIYFHALMDGRDTAPDCGHKYIEELNKEKGFVFASIQGRSIGMDRDRRWEKINKSYDMLIGKGNISKSDPLSYIHSEYKNGILDEFITPILFDEEYAIREEDSVFFLNFRPDRAIQITLAMTDPDFKEFNRPVRPNYYLCMTPYVDDLVKLPILFDKEKIVGGLSQFISERGEKQFKIAETEKYAHITFFFNGGKKEPFPDEERLLIPSPREVATYDQKPEMSAYQVTDGLLEALEKKDFKLYIVNFANSDMVGHTGNYQAILKAIETIDQCLGKLLKKCEEEDIPLILTSDHGNSDQVIYADGSPHTAHTHANAPFSIFHKSLKGQKIYTKEGMFALKDVAPTLLYVLGIDPPDSFTGQSIFK